VSSASSPTDQGKCTQGDTGPMLQKRDKLLNADMPERHWRNPKNVKAQE
jgi:hypothetical protein